MGSWQHAGRMLRGLRENRGWEVPRLAVELKAQATAIGQALPDRQSLVRMIYEWEAGTHRPRAYYVLFVLVYATEEELAARTIRRGSELSRLMAALKAMGVPVNRRQFLLNAAAPAGGLAGLPTVAANLEGQERLVWVLKHPRSVDLPTVAYLRAQTLDLMRQYEAVASPTSLLPQAAERLEQITLLREHAPLGRVQQELWRVRRSRPRCWAARLGRVRPTGPRDGRPLLRPGHRRRQQPQGRLGRGVPPHVPALPTGLHRRREPPQRAVPRRAGDHSGSGWLQSGCCRLVGGLCRRSPCAGW